MKKHPNVTETFGAYIKGLRIKNNIGQRDIAKKIELAPAYFNDIEKNMHSGPRIDLIKKSINIKIVRFLNNHLC